MNLVKKMSPTLHRSPCKGLRMAYKRSTSMQKLQERKAVVFNAAIKFLIAIKLSTFFPDSHYHVHRAYNYHKGCHEQGQLEDQEQGQLHQGQGCHARERDNGRWLN